MGPKGSTFLFSVGVAEPVLSLLIALIDTNGRCISSCSPLVTIPPAVAILLYAELLVGSNLNLKSKLMIGWAPNSEFDSNERMNDCVGDLSVAVRMAYAHGIIVFNTAVPANKHRLLKWIGGDKR